ncbi:nitroreductase family protein [Myxococcus sp. K15C18031901]|uniref:nitroreductase family protein n=1 Tax=Myxococcus dinghuensis TaxID=2906761 RepID=UPI0020A72D75|nr:nitroreductase family protein [Myxococcus dinghuensis]MCP3099079.1 nitroreductase family protein [Myxococcus dinghuensis]
MSKPSSDAARWGHFQALNEHRRAVRDFDGAPLDDADVRAVLEAALLAPSSGNLQPYELHWLRDEAVKRRVAEACNTQRAARTASTLVVVAASRRIGQRTAASWWAHLDAPSGLDARSRAWHQAEARKFARFLRFAPLLVWTPVRMLLSLFDPVYSLLPIGTSGMRHWAARSGIYAAQTLMLAASARGLDSCPMEGFDAGRVARALGLPRGTVIPLVIALGRRRPDARIEPRWRRPVADTIVEH